MVFLLIFTHFLALTLVYVGNNLVFSGLDSVLLGRRCSNTLVSIVVDGAVVEGVQPVRRAVFDHFSAHFQATGAPRPAVDYLVFRTLTYAKVGGLTRPFSKEEIKVAVWDCDSFKSHGPDGVNFGFI